MIDINYDDRGTNHVLRFFRVDPRDAFTGGAPAGELILTSEDLARCSITWSHTDSTRVSSTIEYTDASGGDMWDFIRIVDTIPDRQYWNVLGTFIPMTIKYSDSNHNYRLDGQSVLYALKTQIGRENWLVYKWASKKDTLHKLLKFCERAHVILSDTGSMYRNPVVMEYGEDYLHRVMSVGWSGNYRLDVTPLGIIMADEYRTPYSRSSEFSIDFTTDERLISGGNDMDYDLIGTPNDAIVSAQGDKEYKKQKPQKVLGETSEDTVNNHETTTSTQYNVVGWYENTPNIEQRGYIVSDYQESNSLDDVSHINVFRAARSRLKQLAGNNVRSWTKEFTYFPFECGAVGTIYIKDVITNTYRTFRVIVTKIVLNLSPLTQTITFSEITPTTTFTDEGS